MDIQSILQEAINPTIALFFVAGIAVGAVFAARPWRYVRFLRNVFRLLTTPLRRIGILGKASRRFKSARNAAVTSRATISILDRKTEIEKAIFLQRHDLFKPGEEVELDEDSLRKLEKKNREFEKRYLVRSQKLLFNRIQIPPTYTPNWMAGGLSEETVAEFRQHADSFFNGVVDLTANEEALYEDVDGAHTIYMFGNNNADLAAYNLINEARKNINANALKLILSFLFTVLASLGVVLFITQQTPFSAIPLTIGVVLLAFLQFAYRNMQEHSIRSLGKFMNLYVGYISDRFRDVTGQALGVPVGNEKDAAVLSENAKIWNKLMIWMAFRAFFIEAFLRNELYQIHRNSGYYKLFSDILVFAAIPFLVYVGHAFGYYDLSLYLNGHARYIIGGAAILGLTYFILIRIKVITEELQQQDWRGFDKLQLGDKMDDVVGKYAEEIGYWKQRLER